MDDLMNLLDSDEKPFQSQEQAPKQYNKSFNRNNSEPKVDLWNKTDFTPVKINAENFTHANKTFSIRLYSQSGTIPHDIEEKVLEFTKALAAKGYTYRFGADANDKFQATISSLEGLHVEYYLPWKKFNLDVKNPTMPTPSEKAYGLGFNYHKIFTKLPAPVRAITAKDMHVLLGKECNNPLEFFIIYTACGSESLSKQSDYKVLGPLSLMLKIASESNIPVFNFKQEDAVKRLVDFIKSKSI